MGPQNRFALLAALSLATACPPTPAGDCQNNPDCDVGEVCRDGACVSAEGEGEGVGEGEGDVGEGEGEEGEGEGDGGEGEGEAPTGFRLRSSRIVAGGGVQVGGAFHLKGAIEATGAASSSGGAFRLRSQVFNR